MWRSSFNTAFLLPLVGKIVLESRNALCELIMDQLPMHTYCYLDDPTPKARMTIEDVNLCIANDGDDLGVRNK
jgi:hypothetical protein